MDNLQWRGRARIVAIVDLVLTILGLLLLVLALFGAGFLTAVAHDKDLWDQNQQNEKLSDEDQRKFAEAQELLRNNVWILWVILGLAVVFSIIQMWAAVKLMNATNLDNQLHNALRQATFWRNVTVVFLVFSVVGGALQGAYVSAVISLLLRGLFLYIVHQFMTELEQHLTSPNQNQGPTMVTVVKN